ncbi:MAG: hypothetical protein J1D87_05070 [Lachnospiraceae bacterium]|nr:hypothetical protein [Lachnospiraceae bacterium]
MVLRLLGRDENSFVISHNEKAQERSEARNGKANDAKASSKSINMSGLGFTDDAVLFRKQLARKRAMKIISDAWAGDKKINQNLDDIRSDRDRANAEISEYTDYIMGYKDKKAQLKEYYGIEDENYTKEEAALLKKEAEAAENPEITLTQEEQEKLEQLKNSPLYKYKQEISGLDAAISNYELKIDKAKNEVIAANSQITGIQLERLKYYEMLKAQKKADKINEEASKEAIGMLIGEAQDHIKEEFEEKVEEAKKRAEEKEEQEEKLEEKREEKEEFKEQLEIERKESREAERTRIEQEKNAREQSDIIEGAEANSDDATSALPSEIKAQIKEMLQKMKLLEEDLKGAEVDDVV